MTEDKRCGRFVKLLKDIFELDKSDLNFGIYRIMNLRKAQIEDFLTQRLPQMVRETLEPFAEGNQSELRAQMEEMKANAAQFDMDITSLPESNPMGKKYRALQKQLAEGVDLAALETDVYSALYSFFDRYFDNGDFIAKRRYQKDVYFIPYGGEEIKLYWVNQDQYYIKTSENFKDYAFEVDGYTVRFCLVDATTEQNNNKENKDSKRTFMLFPENEECYPGLKTFEWHAERRELIVRFVFDIQTRYSGKSDTVDKKWQEDNYAAISAYIFASRLPIWQELLRDIPTGNGKETTTLLKKHLKSYVAKNTFDYFIHKDLGAFLTNELDFFIKSEIMHLEDLDTDCEKRVETYLAKIKAIKRVGKIIIDFLSQLENFQKKLWLKRKFVVETNWCMTLDRIDESFWAEILANQAQIAEWISLYAIDEVEGWSNPPTVAFLRQNLNLIVDTKHFSSTFTDALIESIPDLDRQTNGLLIHSENFQALNLLYNRYRGRVSCCYYDPPYNTSENTFLYKNGYKDSSWATMMNDRIDVTKSYLKPNGVLCTAIDDYEHSLLTQILDQNFGLEGRLGNLVIEIKPSGRTNDNFLATSHEQILFYGMNPNGTDICFFPLREDQTAQYKEDDGQGAHKWRDFMRTGGYSTPEERPNSFYPIYYQEETGEITLEKKEGFVEILPIDTVGKYRVWRKTKPSFLQHLKAGEIRIGKKRDNSGYKVQIIDRIKEGVRPKSVWVAGKYDAATHGTKWIKSVFGDTSPFSFPKSVHAVYDTLYTVVGDDPTAVVMDIFAGSATTGEAVVRLNRNVDEDGMLGSRMYILVEMGEYFDTVAKPRMQKIVYASDWKDGKPQSRNTGTSHILKYMSLESYEDALSNIKLSEDNGQLALRLGEEYLIRYMVDFESRDSLLDVKAFANPFAYTMNITEKNECRERAIDLCETFNYLIGLTVIRQGAISCFYSKPATVPAYQGAVDLVGDMNGQYAFRQVEGILPDGSRALVIWRTVTEDILASNAALDAYFTTYRKNARDRNYDWIFVNGDSNLENLRGSHERWKVQMIESEFKKRMFEEV